MYAIFHNLADFIAPRHCIICGKRLHSEEHALCIACMMEMSESQYSRGIAGNVLERSLWQTLPVVRAAAFLTYSRSNRQRDLVLRLKYYNHPGIGVHLGQMMCRPLADSDFFHGIDAIVPVPIPLGKKLRRGYNQSEMLANGVSKATGIPVNTHIIKRRPYKVSQTRLSPAERKENVKGSFVLHNAADMEGKHLLIVDDVITTTATVIACGQTLCQIRGVRLSVLSLAVSENLISNLQRSNPENEE